MPAKSFWSVILYNAETYAMIANPLKKYAISSLNFFVGFRFYGPDWDRLGKTWTAKRPEKIN